MSYEETIDWVSGMTWEPITVYARTDDTIKNHILEMQAEINRLTNLLKG